MIQEIEMFKVARYIKSNGTKILAEKCAEASVLQADVRTRTTNFKNNLRTSTSMNIRTRRTKILEPCNRFSKDDLSLVCSPGKAWELHWS